MIRPLPLRPLGPRDLQALRGHAQALLDDWARAWLGQGNATLQLSTDGAASATPIDAAWCEALAQRCLAAAPPAPGPAPALPRGLWATLGRAALDALQRTLGTVGAEEGGRKALRVDLQLADLALSVAWPHAAWSQALPSAPAVMPPLGAVPLPQSLDRALRHLQVTTTAFELPVADLMALAVGDIVVTDQGLDEPFQIHVQDLPEAGLQAHLGRRGNRLAIELLPR